MCGNTFYIYLQMVTRSGRGSFLYFTLKKKNNKMSPFFSTIQLLAIQDDVTTLICVNT